MFLLTTWALRCTGFSGILGALLFIWGDLLYNHIPGSPASPAVKMGTLPQSRLLLAGTLGLVGCWFYTLAALHVFLAFRPAGDVFSFVMLLAFGAVMICYGLSHVAYFAIAAGAQVAARNGTGLEEGGSLGKAFYQRLVTITYIPVAVSSGMMLYGIITGHSLYPKWMVVLLPIVIYLLKAPVVRILKGRAKELVNDSYDNLVLLVYFLISTIVLWNGVVV